ncbi:hypothetical protein HY947_03700 [Candidatus Gottesmanbacteria bacterium]|nr:hypothetical protein [Candidatus Gottesmanbacteria bacterium]
MKKSPARASRDGKTHEIYLRKKQIDLALIIIFPFIATFLALFFDLTFFASTLLYYGTPALYLSLRSPYLARKASIFALLFAIPFGLIIEYLAILDRSWFIPFSWFGYRIFGVISLDAITWGILLTYSIVLFYEYFIDHGKNKTIDKHLIHLVYVVIILLLIFFVFITTRPASFSIPYFYLWIGIILAGIPALTLLIQVPTIIAKYIKTSTYFFLIAVLSEYTGLRLGHWMFPGKNFLGWIPFMGFRIPIEEAVFFFLLATVGIVAIYEFFDDDGR